MPGLDDTERRRASTYMGEFFTTIGSPDLVKRELIDSCGGRTTS